MAVLIVVWSSPGSFKVLTDLRANAAIVVSERNYDCVAVDSSQLGVCIAIEGKFGRMLVASLYCQFSELLDPYLG